MPYFAYLPAEALDVSAVVAAVTAGIYSAMHAPRIVTPTSRLQLNALWELVVFLLNARCSCSSGCSSAGSSTRSTATAPARTLGYAAAVSATVIAGPLPLGVPGHVRCRDALGASASATVAAAGRRRFVIAWTGMRGAVSLAAALAIPESRGGGEFPQRDLIIFFTFA